MPIIRKKITQEIINSYALISGDHNPIHLDKEYDSKIKIRGTFIEHIRDDKWSFRIKIFLNS